MAYKSLFSVLTDPNLTENVLAHAVATADALDAHLDVLCLGVDRSQTGYYYAGANAMVLQETINRAQEEAESVEEKAKTILSRSGIRWSTGTVLEETLGRALQEATRLARSPAPRSTKGHIDA